MVLAADYPFLDVLWTLLVFFLWISWFMLLFHAIGDVFRRRDIGGGTEDALADLYAFRAVPRRLRLPDRE